MILAARLKGTSLCRLLGSGFLFNKKRCRRGCLETRTVEAIGAMEDKRYAEDEEGKMGKRGP